MYHFICIVIFLWLGTADIPFAQQQECPKNAAEYNPPRFSEREQERNQMVEQDLIPMGIDDPDVIDAMKQVPRHLFVASNMKAYAYENSPLPIGRQQTISQPYIVAYMNQLLELQPGDKVLEIGTGSGYHAAVLSELTPCVYTIEIIDSLGKTALQRFEDLGYSSIQTKIGDGYEGWEKFAPYDGIILTAAPDVIPQPLIDQLAENGVLIAPVGEDIQFLTKLTKDKGEIRQERKIPVRFVPMTGDRQEQH